jgi:hypothetical protein
MPHVQACIAYSCSCPAEATTQTQSRSKAYLQIFIIVVAFFLLHIIGFVFSTLVDDDEPQQSASSHA